MPRDVLRVLTATLCVLSLVFSAALLPGAGISAGGFGGFSLGNATPGGLERPEGALGQTQLINRTRALDNAGILATGTQTSVGGPVPTGPGGLSAEVLFTVESDRPAYWRSSAFVTYTGDGWTRPDDERPYEAPIYENAKGETVVQTITAKQPMAVVPAAFKPVRIRNPPDGVTVSGRGGISLSSPLDSGDSVTVVSRVSRPSESALQSAGTDYPAAIEDKYTALPDDVPDRVSRKTQSIVDNAGADTPYAKAKAIERWLERNKEYSLNASKPEDDFVDTFLFEMEKGYCEYFATAMVVMLRTQGIPARYVTGFSTGQAVGNDTYVVRRMNAHAWVEVYFPGEGWVTFDPTPASARITQERVALQEGRSSGDENVDTGGSANSTYDPGGVPGNTSGGNGTDGGIVDRPTGNRTDGNETDDTRNRSDFVVADSSAVNVSLSRDPIPGAEVVVTVTRNGTPLEGAIVLFNGERVGVTNASGQVTGTVPYSESLDVAVLVPNESSAGVPPPGDDRLYSVESAWTPPDDGALDGPPDDNESNSTVSYDLETEAAIDLSSAPAPGKSVVLTATVGGVPMTNAKVSVNGRFVGRTNASGQIRIRLPWAESTRIEVTRGEVTGTRRINTSATVDVAVSGRTPGRNTTIHASVSGRDFSGATVFVNGTKVGTLGPNGTVTTVFPYNNATNVTVRGGNLSKTVTVNASKEFNVTVHGLRFPGATLTVEVTLAGRPVPNVTVTIAGGQRVRTGPNGTATVTAPFSNSAAVTVRKGGLETTVWVSGILVPVVGGVAVLGLIAGLVIARVRYGVGVPLYPGEIARSTLSVLIGTVAVASTVGESIADALGTVLDRYREASSLSEFLGDLPALARAGLSARWAVAVEWLRVRVPFLSSTDGDPVAGDFDPDATAADDRVRAVERAWSRLTDRLRVSNSQARTPGEYMRRAIETGYPRDAVRRLTDAFREVEYSQWKPTDEHETTATEAIARIERDESGGDGE